MSKKSGGNPRRIANFLALARQVKTRVSAQPTSGYAEGYLDALHDVEKCLRNGPKAVERQYWDGLADAEAANG